MVWLTGSLACDGVAAALAPAPSAWFLGAAAVTASKLSGTSSTSTLTSVFKTMAGGTSMTGDMLPMVDDGPCRLNDDPEVVGLCAKQPCASRVCLGELWWLPIIFTMQVGEKDGGGDGRGRRQCGRRGEGE
jgi:hypothetical protein